MIFNQITLLAVTAISVVGIGLLVYSANKAPVSTTYNQPAVPVVLVQPNPVLNPVPPLSSVNNTGGSRRHRKKKSHKKTKKR